MVKVHMDSNWTVQSSGLQWTPVHFSHIQSRYKLAVKKVYWSPVESSGVHMEYGGDCKDLSEAGPVTLPICGVIYYTGNHFVSRLISPTGEVWYHDGIETYIIDATYKYNKISINIK